MSGPGPLFFSRGRGERGRVTAPPPARVPPPAAPATSAPLGPPVLASLNTQGHRPPTNLTQHSLRPSPGERAFRFQGRPETSGKPGVTPGEAGSQTPRRHLLLPANTDCACGAEKPGWRSELCSSCWVLNPARAGRRQPGGEGTGLPAPPGAGTHARSEGAHV